MNKETRGTAFPSQVETELNQAERFRIAAEALECDPDEGRFEEKVKRVATAPKPEPEK